MPLAKVLVSSCLLGAEVRYHGGSARIESPILERWIAENRVVGLCPEVAGGLSVPRPAAECTSGDGEGVLSGTAAVMTGDGNDVTDSLLAGAEHAVAVARSNGIRVAVLKSRSPSCGSSEVYDGSFTGRLIDGSGVTAAALKRAGVHVFDEHALAHADEVLRNLEESSGV